MSHHHHAEQDPHADPVAFWESRYGEKDAIWSGRANRALVDAVADLPTGTALDLGCGEGGDAIWLAEQGWQVLGVDLSPTAVARATRAAADRDVAGRTEFLAVDLETWRTDREFDLVSGCFLQSPLEFPREQILGRAADLVAPGGHLLSVGHAAAPPWSRMADDHDIVFPTPEGDLAAIGGADRWTVLVAEVRGRDATGPDGEHAVLLDSVVLVRRDR